MVRHNAIGKQPRLGSLHRLGKDALERATEIWQQALREYEQPAMDPAIREELDAYIARRKEEIGAGEP